jgi:nicotinate phosphoribosyltransferase
MRPARPPKDFANSMPVTPLATDLYQLTMLAGYFHTGRRSRRATFEMFTRRFPANRNCLLFAGLEQALSYLEELRFTADDVTWLSELPVFAGVANGFFDFLRSLRFTGDVWAMPEGTPFLPDEPVLRVTAPLAEAQLVETALLAIVNFQTTIASKALRVVLAAEGRPVMEFGARRAHGLEAALYAARAAYLAGCASTSFVEAGRRFGIPLSGTMAHSWILAADSQRQAFADFAALFGPESVLLLDTYDVVTAARDVVTSGLAPAAVRLDSGDLLSLARQVREILDAGGLSGTRIVASGDLDEWRVRELAAGNAPIDAYAVGTALTTSDDAPALGGVYKLVEIESADGMRPVVKKSAGKRTRGGAKQVWRAVEGGIATGDVVALVEEMPIAGARPLLQPVMRAGRRLAQSPLLADVRSRCAANLAALPRALTALDATDPYPVGFSAALRAQPGSGASKTREPGER